MPPGLAWERPSLPSEWVRMLDRHPEGVQALPGYVWLNTPGKPRHVREDELEFRFGLEGDKNMEKGTR